MRIAVFAAIFAFSACPAFGLYYDRDVAHARIHGADMKIVLRVVDQDGFPAKGVKVWGGIQYGDGLKDYTPIFDWTNADGEYVIQGKCNERARCGIIKEGYYSSEFVKVYPDIKLRKPVADGKWMPYGEVYTVVLKKILNPCQVTGKMAAEGIPLLGEWLGYDLELGQWTKPHGSGRHSDMLVRICIDAVNGTSDFRTSMEVSFTNNPHAGAYVLKKDPHSEMQSVYNADTNAAYQSSFFFKHERRPIVRRHLGIVFTNGLEEVDTRLDKDSYVVFRTRTKVDDRGRLLSAHYGRIMGRWRFFGAMRSSGLRFNPTPNDPNLEDADAARYLQMCRRQTEERLAEKWPVKK